MYPHPHHRHVLIALAALGASLLLGLALTACGETDTPVEPSPTPAPPTSTVAPTTPPDLLRYQDQYERLVEANRAIAAVWDGLASGEQVQCGSYPDFPAPEAIPTATATTGDTSLAVHLQDAAIAVDEAVTLWRAECNNPRPTTPPDVIDQGRLATRTAGDALRSAASLLPTAGS